MLRQWGEATGRNALSYSEFDDTGWVSTATDLEDISIGPFADIARVILFDDDTTEESFGTRTWEGPGLSRTLAPADFSTATSTVLFAVDVGFYQQEKDRSMDVELGFTDATGSSFFVVHQETLKAASKRIWFAAPVGSLPGGVDPSEAYFYVEADASPTQRWWWARANVDWDRIRPSNQHLETCGGPVEVLAAIDQERFGAGKVCPECVEILHRKSELIGDPRQETEDPVTTDIQDL